MSTTLQTDDEPPYPDAIQPYVRAPEWAEDIVITAWLSGHSYVEAGWLIGTDNTMAKKILKRSDLDLDSYPGNREAPEDKVDDDWIVVEADAVHRGRETPQYVKDIALTAYLSGATMDEAGKLVGVGAPVVSSWRQEAGIEKRLEHNERPDWMYEAIATAYLSGYTMEKAAAALDASRQVCETALDRLGIEKRDYDDSLRQYDIDKHYFETIDTAEKASWLGLLYADGNLGNDYLVRIRLKRGDEAHIQSFLDAIGSTHPITPYEEVKESGYVSKQSEAHFSCKAMYEDLQAHGLEQNKSRTAQPPTTVPDELMGDFWRGLWDGDGSFPNYDNGNNSKTDDYWTAELTGNPDMLAGFSDYVYDKLGIRRESAADERKKHGRTHKLKYHGKDAYAVAKLLYADAGPEVVLARKYETAHELIQDFEENVFCDDDIEYTPLERLDNLGFEVPINNRRGGSTRSTLEVL